MTGIGIDTGGTCTDAVIYDLDTKQVLASAKSATTHERLEIGIGESLGKLPAGLVRQASYISLSTTLATNACVENKGGRVCLIFIRRGPENGGGKLSGLRLRRDGLHAVPGRGSGEGDRAGLGSFRGNDSGDLSCL